MKDIQVGDLLITEDNIRMLVIEEYPEYYELFVTYPNGKSKMLVVDKKAIYGCIEEQRWQYYPG